MGILITLIVIILVVALAIYAVDLIPVPAPFGNIIKLLIVLVALVYILDRSGLL